MNKYETEGYLRLLKGVPKSKPGIKYLDFSQLENVFPNYRNLIGKIENYRGTLKELDQNRNDSDLQSNLMYDNVFSIFGKRGSGKTSAVFSLRQIIKQYYEYDIVPDVVIPEIIPEGSSLIGWIIALLENHVKDIQQRLEKMPSRRKDFFDKCANEDNDSLLMEYYRIRDMYHTQLYDGKNDLSISNSVSNSELRTQSSYLFANKLSVFWDHLIEKQKLINGDKGEVQPLLYIVFDDVDLRPDAVIELFATITKYLSHPHIIVMVTADESLLLDVVEHNMNRRIGMYDELNMYSSFLLSDGYYPYYRARLRYALNDLDLDILNRKFRMSHQLPKQYSDKILPPSRRYYLKSYNTNLLKSQFVQYVGSTDSNGSADSLMTCIINKVDLLINEFGLDCNKYNFVRIKNSGNRTDGVSLYFAFWGNTSRQLGNEYLILEDFLDQTINNHELLKNKELSKKEYLDKLYFNMVMFAHDSIKVSDLYDFTEDEISELVSDLILYNTAEWGIYLNYLAIDNELNKYSENKRETFYRRALGLFMLLFFLENIIMLEYKSKDGIFIRKREKLHGLGMLTDLADNATSDNYSLICKNLRQDTTGYLYFYSRLLDNYSMLSSFNITDVRFVRRYFNELERWDKLGTLNLKKSSTDNPKWFRTHTQMLYLMMTGIYNVGKNDLSWLKIDTHSSTVCDTYYERSIDKIRETCEDVLCNQWNDTYINTISKEWLNFHLLQGKSFDLMGSYPDYDTLREIGEALEKENLSFPWDEKRFLNESEIERLPLGKPGCTLILQENINNIIDKLNESYRELNRYKVDENNKELQDLLKKTDNWQFFVSESEDYKINKEQSKSVQEKKYRIISRDNLNKILDKIFDYYKKQEDRMYANDFDSKGEYHKAERIIKENTDIYCKKEYEKKAAVNLYRCVSYLCEIQKYMLSSLLKERTDAYEYQIDNDTNPYCELYEKLKKLSKGDTYMRQLINGLIRKGVRQYLNAISGDRSNG